MTWRRAAARGRAACVAGLVALCAARAAAQSVTVRVGPAASVGAAPNVAVEVPLVVDFAGVTGVSLASLTARVTYDPARLAWQRADAGTFGSVTGNAATPGTAVVTLFASRGTSATFTAATLRFAATAQPGTTTVSVAVQSAGNDLGQSIASRVVAGPALTVCVGAGGGERWGDVNGDGAADVLDAQQLARFAVGLSVADAARVQRLGDVSGDGTVDVIDAQQVARFAVGLATSGRAGQGAAPSCTTPVVVQATALGVASDVPSALTRQIERVYSGVDAASLGASARLQLAADDRGTLVLALDNAQRPLLAAFATSATGAQLGATSTALALARLAMGPTGTSGMTSAAIDAAVRAAPTFGRLETQLRADVAAARVLLDDPMLGGLAAAVASEVLKVLARPSATVASSVAAGRTYVNKLPHYVVSSPLFGENVWIDDVPGQGVNLFNGSRLDWAATSRDADGKGIDTQTLPLMPFDFWSFLPIFNTTPSITAILGNSTRFTITIEQDKTTRGKHVLELIRQSALTVMDLTGVAKKSELAGCGVQIAKLLLNDKFPDALNLQSGDAVVAYISKGLSSFDDPRYWIKLFQSCGAELPTVPSATDIVGRFSKGAASLLGAMQTAEPIGKLGEFTYQFVKYFDASYTVTVCKEKGQVTICPDTIVVTPPSARVGKGGTVTLVAKVVGADGSDMTAKYPVTWSSSDLTLVVVDAKTGVVRALQRDGSTTVRAAVAGIFTEVPIAVGEVPATIEFVAPLPVTTLRRGDVADVSVPVRNKGAPNTQPLSFRLANADGSPWVRSSGVDAAIRSAPTSLAAGATGTVVVRVTVSASAAAGRVPVPVAVLEGSRVAGAATLSVTVDVPDVPPDPPGSTPTVTWTFSPEQGNAPFAGWNHSVRWTTQTISEALPGGPDPLGVSRVSPCCIVAKTGDRIAMNFPSRLSGGRSMLVSVWIGPVRGAGSYQPLTRDDVGNEIGHTFLNFAPDDPQGRQEEFVLDPTATQSFRIVSMRDDLPLGTLPRGSVNFAEISFRLVLTPRFGTGRYVVAGTGLVPLLPF